MTGANRYKFNDYPLVREGRICPCCERAKRRGNLACEPCLRKYDMRCSLSRKRARAIVKIEQLEAKYEQELGKGILSNLAAERR
jgi:hypothetical protein